MADLVIKTDRPRKLAVTYQEAAAMLGVSESLIRRLVYQRTLPAIRIGRAVRIKLSDLERWVDEQPEAVYSARTL